MRKPQLKDELTDVGVAEGVLRVRQGARAALREPRELQAAEHEQQAEQVLLQHGLHVSKVGCAEQFNRVNSGPEAAASPLHPFCSRRERRTLL